MFAQVSGPNRVLPYLDQRVYLNGRRRSDIFCVSVSLNAGVSGSSAQFEMPASSWDDDKNSLRGAFVQVEAGYRGSNKKTLFSGYVASITSNIAGQSQSFTAHSLMAFAHKVYVGDANPSDGMEIKYPRYAYLSGVKTKTNWDAKQILRDIFNSSTETWRGGGGSISSEWRSKLKLGNLSAFDDAGSIDMPDVEFHQETLSGALDKLLALYGNVSFYESFSGNETTLEFYQLATKQQSKKLYVLPQEEAGSYSNILDAQKEEGYIQSISRMIGIGGKRNFLVSVFSDSGTVRLEKAWDRSLDVQALNNPVLLMNRMGAGGSDDASPSYDHRYQFVFRRYKIPAALLSRINQEADFEVNGLPIPIQVFCFPYLVSEDAGAWTGAVSTTPQLIDAEVDPQSGIILLKEPAVSPSSATYNNLTGQTALTYSEMQVGITLVVTTGNLYVDLAGGNVNLNGLQSDGIKEVARNDSFKFAQITNIGHPIDGTTYGSTWYSTDTGWTNVTIAQEVRNDLPQFYAFVSGALREKNNFSQSYSIQMPFFSLAYQIGDNIQVINERNKKDYGRHQISSVAHNLTNNHGTSLSTENNAGLYNNGVMGI